MSTRGGNVALGLYRNILRAHQRHLPSEMRALGDAYVKSEFKLHKKVTNEAQLDAFFIGWDQYLDQILQTARRQATVSAGSLDATDNQGFGRSLPNDIELSEEQQAQLEKLKEEAAAQPTNRQG